MRIALRLGALFAAIALLGGCRLVATVDVELDEGGSGTVTVGVGLDDDALARLGDPTVELRLDDLTDAGWQVEGPTLEGDLTWLRATRPFADDDELQQVLDEVAGPGVLEGWATSEESSLLATDWRIDGTVDVAGGVDRFGDPGLSEALGGDPLGGLDERLEAETGMPVEDQIEVLVTASLPDGTSQAWEPSLGDEQATVVALEASQPTTLARWWWAPVAAVVAVAMVVALAALRRRWSPPRRGA